MLLHITSFHFDRDSQRHSLWHSLSPTVRLLCAVGTVFAVVLTRNGQWGTWGLYGLSIVVWIGISRVTIPVLLRRVAVESVFISVVLLGILIHPQGVVIWQWGWLQVTHEGLVLLGSVASKAGLSLLMLNLLTLTTPWPDLLQALLQLKTPPLLVAILAAMVRYVEVLVEEVASMQRAAVARNFSGSSPWRQRVLGNMIGSLFIRTLERGERIHRSMLARGYRGVPTALRPMQMQRLDLWALGLTGLWIVVGQLWSLR